MTPFHEVLLDRFSSGGFSTDDVLLAFLPLVRETLKAHDSGFVAPLEGLDDLEINDGKIWFPEAKRLRPRNVGNLVQQIQRAAEAGVEILSEIRRTSETGDGSEELVDVSVGVRGEEIKRPVYLPGYVVWEHELGHHDPSTDVFSLGMILASLALGLDFTEPNDLRRFVAARRNLFSLRSDLHPAIAQAVFKMTELDRRRRVQDLAAMLGNLENYRDQEIDFEFDLAGIQGFKTQTRKDKRGTILTRLRQRLFDISKRNRLLHFKPTLQTVNLTHSSIPISFDIKKIPKDRILVWNADIHKAVVQSAGADKSISLNKYLNFAEAIYLPPTLDRIIAEVRRDEAEFGFAQLRLVACFLHWADLKQKPAQHYDSPLILIPVELKKKKGIKDTYQLDVQTTDAEVNPVLRHLFKQLYNIELPETVDLAQTTLDEFFSFLQARIAASEPAVTLSKLDVPRIALIHDKAKRRLDQYAKRARLAGRGVRSFLDIDYSYDPVNFHPLGVRLFAAKIQPPVALLQRLTSELPTQAPRTSYSFSESTVPEKKKAAPAKATAVEVEKSFFAVQDASELNPYQWNFDLCGVTLGNFRYHKMSLVRDYESLLDEMPENPAFEATFSLSPKEIAVKPEGLPLKDRYDVVPCDPTQAESIARARTRKSYIIQGPPGTGKSQTITNLIADFAARGKRILFVCEKRAAIDVVFARLRQCGLDDLCSLIHDSQADKKEFVMNLKQTYETILAESETSKSAPARDDVLQKIRKELSPLDAFDRLMQTPLFEKFATRDLLRRSLELDELRPTLDPLQTERLPNYRDWFRNSERMDDLGQRIESLQSRTTGVFASHPLRGLSSRLVLADRPVQTVTKSLESAGKSLVAVTETLEKCGVPKDLWNSLDKAVKLLDYVETVAPWIESGHLAMLEEKSEASKRFVQRTKILAKLETEHRNARDANAGWFDGKKLTPEETSIALEQARVFEQSFFSWLNPARWRLRSLLNNSYEFSSHRIRPSWTGVLALLEKEHQATARLEASIRELGTEWNIQGDIRQWIANLMETRKRLLEPTPEIVRVHAAMLKSDDEKQRKIVARILAAKDPLSSLVTESRTILESPDSLALEQLGEELEGISESLNELPEVLDCLRELRRLPDDLRDAVREIPLTLPQLEAATASDTTERILRGDKTVHKFNGAERERRAAKLERLYDDWRTENATEIRRRIHRGFLENVHIANGNGSDPKDPRTNRTWKQRYNRGRRELEHEFGKTMRYKSIRDLVSGESGEVVRDLKPIWLMSPLSVSDTLPLETNCFDIVIFDEASQITLEEAVPPLFRATQAIVVGDEKQLPPTDFFSSRRDEGDELDDEESTIVEPDGERIRYDLDGNSFLNHAARNLSSTMLGWHYRSRSESLISFSNAAFYDGRLLTVPDVRVQGIRDDLDSSNPLDSPLEFVYLSKGVYDKRRNRTEADKIAELTRELLQREDRSTVGIIAFSEAQQEEIETALERLAQLDAGFAERLESERQREEDGQFVGLLVKNLENIQGDERDVIILSICYGYNPSGKMFMNFGPINKSGGERRLNVAFSRAKRKMIVVSSIKSEAITNDFNQGAACLKNYLRYAEAVATGQTEAARSVLHSASGHLGFDQRRTTIAADPLSDRLARRLREKGFLVDAGIGSSDFRCDLVVRRPGDSTYRLGILFDHDGYYDQTAGIEKPELRAAALIGREMMRPKLLRNFDWNIVIVLAKDWFESPESVIEDLLRRLQTPKNET